jgi:hypothetical protein
MQEEAEAVEEEEAGTVEETKTSSYVYPYFAFKTPYSE